MMPIAATQIECPDGVPTVWLLEARGADVALATLKASARALTDRADVRHSSRSYRYPYALVSWHTDAVGVDVERIEPFDAVFAASISTPSDRVQWSALSDPDAHLTSIWSSKEALAKALGNALSYDPLRLEAPAHWPDGRAGCWHAHRLPIVEGHVAWICWR